MYNGTILIHAKNEARDESNPTLIWFSTVCREYLRERKGGEKRRYKAQIKFVCFKSLTTNISSPSHNLDLFHLNRYKQDRGKKLKYKIRKQIYSEKVREVRKANS